MIKKLMSEISSNNSIQQNNKDNLVSFIDKLESDLKICSNKLSILTSEYSTLERSFESLNNELSGLEDSIRSLKNQS